MEFSVIIPVYNVADVLKPCLDSVLAATAGRDVEIICVDDGSTDDSAGILAHYAAADARVRVFRQENAGVSAARNRALDEAKGDWLLFVDSDDVVRETWLASVAEAIGRQPDVDLVGFGMVSLVAESPLWGEQPEEWLDMGIAQTIPDRMESMSVYRFAYRRDRMGDLRFPAYRYGEDLMFVAEALARSRKCLVRDRAEYAYRWRQGSATRNTMKPEIFLALAELNVNLFRCLVASGKTIGAGFVARRTRWWLEEQPRLILPHRKEAGWDRAWKTWLDSMSVAAELPCLTARQRRRARRVSAARSAWSVRWNCLLPSWWNRKVRSR